MNCFRLTKGSSEPQCRAAGKPGAVRATILLEEILTIFKTPHQVDRATNRDRSALITVLTLGITTRRQNSLFGSSTIQYLFLHASRSCAPERFILSNPSPFHPANPATSVEQHPPRRFRLLLTLCQDLMPRSCHNLLPSATKFPPRTSLYQFPSSP